MTDNIQITLSDYELIFDSESGLLIGLSRAGSPPVLGHGDGPTPLGADLAWHPVEAEPGYESHHLEDQAVTVTIRLGSLTLHDHYTVQNDILARRLRVENTSAEEAQLTGIRMGLRGAAVGEADACLFEAPGNTIRPRLPLAFAASLPGRDSISNPDVNPASAPAEIAPGAEQIFGITLGHAPDFGPGLMVIHNPAARWSLLTWYYSEIEAAAPWVIGDGTVVTMGFDVQLAGWLAPGASLEGGTQYIALHRGDYQSALSLYREAVTELITPTVYGHPNKAQDWVGIYEAHPGQFGGFEAMRAALPKIEYLGVDTIYLLPVMAHRNKVNRPWDGNWENVGSPYAMHDFESFEPSLGTETQFTTLVEGAHALGMRVLMDFVSQGCSLESHYVKDHPEWFARDEQGNMVHSHGWNDTWSFDWANPAFQAYMIDWATRFIEEYDIDGYRVDAPHGKEPNWDRDIPYHASQTNLGTSDLLDDLRRAIGEANPDARMLCELFGPMWLHNHDISYDYFPHAMVLQLFEGRLTPAEFGEYLKDYWAIMPRLEADIPVPRVCFTETHDTRGRPAYALRGSAISQALLGILVMSGFTPMIWSGQEKGQEDFIRGLMLARRENKTLRRGKRLFNEVTIDDENHYRRSQGDDPAGSTFAVIRYDDNNVLFGLASLVPERITYRFGLPVEKLNLKPGARYQLRDLITYRVWEEYGTFDWTGEELASFYLTPQMYTPYIFRIEEIKK